MEEENKEGLRQPESQQQSKDNSAYLIPGAIIAAGVLIALSVFYSNSNFGKGGTGESPKLPVQQKTPTLRELAGNGPMLGNPDAPVTVIEFADFQCPFCGRYFKNVEPQLLDRYVKTGKVKFIYRDFAFLGEESEWGAEAARCANDQGKFWQYHDYLFNHQSGENSGAFAKENLKQFARALGLVSVSFDACLDSEKYLKAVQNDTDAGRSFGVGGTPTTFVNGQAVSGAVPFSDIAAVVEAALKKTGK